MPRARDAVKQLVVRAGAGQVRPSSKSVMNHRRYMSSLRRNQSVTSVLLNGRANGAPTRIGRARCSANRARDEGNTPSAHCSPRHQGRPATTPRTGWRTLNVRFGSITLVASPSWHRHWEMP